jgi:hypothetical protein
MSPDTAARLAPRLHALFALHRPAAAAEALTAEALRRCAQLPDTAPAEQVHAVARALLDGHHAASEALAAEQFDALDAAPDPELHQALRAALARLGTEAARLLLGYYRYGADGRGDSADLREQRRRQLAERCTISREALRERALAIREALETAVLAAPAATGSDGP